LSKGRFAKGKRGKNRSKETGRRKNNGGATPGKTSLFLSGKAAFKDQLNRKTIKTSANSRDRMVGASYKKAGRLALSGGRGLRMNFGGTSRGSTSASKKSRRSTDIYYFKHNSRLERERKKKRKSLEGDGWSHRVKYGIHPDLAHAEGLSECLRRKRGEEPSVLGRGERRTSKNLQIGYDYGRRVYIF